MFCTISPRIHREYMTVSRVEEIGQALAQILLKGPLETYFSKYSPDWR